MAFDGEDNSLEMIVLASATYAIFKLKGPATAAVWGSFHSAKKHCEMIEQPSVEVYPLGNHQANDYEMKVNSILTAFVLKSKSDTKTIRINQNVIFNRSMNITMEISNDDVAHRTN